MSEQRKTWDGHAVALSFEGSGFVRGEWVCPYEGRTFAGEETPQCRRAWNGDEDEPTWEPHHRCLAGEHFDDARMDVFDDAYFDITQVPVPVTFWWEAYGEEFFCEPVVVGEDGTYEIPARLRSAA